MSIWNESHEDCWERRKEERREFEGDVAYEAYRRGYDPDRASRCAGDCYDEGRTAEECVNGYAREVREARERREMEQHEEEQRERDYYEQREQEEPLP